MRKRFKVSACNPFTVYFFSLRLAVARRVVDEVPVGVAPAEKFGVATLLGGDMKFVAAAAGAGMLGFALKRLLEAGAPAFAPKRPPVFGVADPVPAAPPNMLVPVAEGAPIAAFTAGVDDPAVNILPPVAAGVDFPVAAAVNMFAPVPPGVDCPAANMLVAPAAGAGDAVLAAPLNIPPTPLALVLDGFDPAVPNTKPVFGGEVMEAAGFEAAPALVVPEADMLNLIPEACVVLAAAAKLKPTPALAGLLPGAAA